MDSHDIESYFRQHRKTLAVVFLIVCMLAVSGFFMGMRQTERQVTRNRLPAAGKHEVSSQEQEIPSAPKYKEISNAEWLANRDWKFTLADLPRAVAPSAGQTAATPAETATAIERRKSLRAYDGAPPVIPHAIDTLKASGSEGEFFSRWAPRRPWPGPTAPPSSWCRRSSSISPSSTSACPTAVWPSSWTNAE